MAEVQVSLSAKATAASGKAALSSIYQKLMKSDLVVGTSIELSAKKDKLEFEDDKGIGYVVSKPRSAFVIAFYDDSDDWDADIECKTEDDVLDAIKALTNVAEVLESDETYLCGKGEYVDHVQKGFKALAKAKKVYVAVTSDSEAFFFTSKPKKLTASSSSLRGTVVEVPSAGTIVVVPE